MNSTNAVVENKMEPVTPAPVTQQLTVTGQYLYDSFVKADDSDRSRMTRIRELAVSADTLQMAGATDKMVELAREADLKAGLPEKEKVVINGKETERRTRGPREASAMNVRTIVRQVWGALKFAPEQLVAAGLTDDTGYQPARIAAKKALDAKRILWDGRRAPTAADRETKRLQREQKVETGVLAKALVDTPRLPGEDSAAHLARVTEAAREQVEQARADAETARVNKLVDDILTKHGNGIALRVAEEIMARLDLAFANATDQVIAEPEPEQTEPEHVEAEQHA